MPRWSFFCLVVLLAIVSVSAKERRRNRFKRCFPGQKVYDGCNRLCVCTENRTLSECTRQRKEFTSMTNAERREYINTVKIASTDPRYKSRYDEHITLHIDMFMTGIHEMKHFLTWHRWYLLEFENLLREINCKVTLPYWDWSIAAADPWGNGTEDLWYSGETGFGGNGNVTQGGCISNGPFSGSWLLPPRAIPSCPRRFFYGYPPDVVAVAELLDTHPENFTDFENSLRIIFHDSIHCKIGGTMCSLDSSCAPEFFLHHAFVDKIWADWQNKSIEHKTVFFGSLEEPFPLPEMYGVIMPHEVLDNNALPGDIRVDYLDVNDTETVSFVRKIRKLKRKELEEIERPDFVALNEASLKLFHVNLDEVRKARRRQRKFRPRKVKARKRLRSRKGKKLGLEEADLENAIRRIRFKNRRRKKTKARKYRVRGELD